MNCGQTGVQKFTSPETWFRLSDAAADDNDNNNNKLTPSSAEVKHE
jgi:hypothetical protein